MPRYELDEDFDDLELRHPHWTGDRPHSGLGLASLFAAALGTLLVVGVVAVAFLIDDAQQGQADDELMMGLLGLGFLVAGASGVAGLSLGLIGSVQAERNPLLAVLGTIANIVVLIGMVVVTCGGILSEM